jgi:hypothetical protein
MTTTKQKSANKTDTKATPARRALPEAPQARPPAPGAASDRARAVVPKRARPAAEPAPVTLAHGATKRASPTPERRVGAREPLRTAPKHRTPTQEEIAVRAFEIFVARGGQHGRSDDDWYEAERELRAG